MSIDTSFSCEASFARNESSVHQDASRGLARQQLCAARRLQVRGQQALGQQVSIRAGPLDHVSGWLCSYVANWRTGAKHVRSISSVTVASPWTLG